MKNSLHMFTAVNTGIKFPFALQNLTAALPVTTKVDGGTTLYGVGTPGGIQIQESASLVSELYGEWFKNNTAGQQQGRA